MQAETWNFRMTKFRFFLLCMSVMFVILAAYRLTRGLGASTNLSDQWPWGLWIGMDLAAIALAGAGYSMALLAHVLRIRGMEIVSRRATLISFLSYIFVLCTLILEIGRWDNSFRPLISWGYHSPMFEVFIAISIYVCIQFVEIGEVVSEKICKGWNLAIRRVLPYAFILGAIIPFGHQASLGAIYLSMKDKLHPLWWSPNLPWFFLLTSFYVGQSVIILNVLFLNRTKKNIMEFSTLVKLTQISTALMGIYLVYRGLDLAFANNWRLAFSFSFEAIMFWIEIGLGTIIPFCIGISFLKKNTTGLFIFSLLSILGVVVSRINVVYSGMIQAQGNGYTPSWIEWGISLGLLSVIIWLYTFLVENFRFYHIQEIPSSGDKALAA